MNQKEIEDGNKATKIFKKHLKELKEEFNAIGIKLVNINGVDGMFEWQYQDKE